MKVLMLTSSYEPLHGGAETYARLLCEGLVADGHDVVIATDGSWLDHLPGDREEDAGRVVRLRDFADRVDARDKVRWRQMQYSVLDELGAVLKGESFDVVHANSHETLILASIVALETDAALVCSLHEQNPDLERFGRGRCRLSYQTLPVDMHFVPSRFFAERAARFGAPADRIRLVHNGVPDAPPDDVARNLRSALRAELGVAPDHRLVVLPGRMSARKAQLDLAAALPLVAAELPEVRVLLSGRVSDYAYEKSVWDRLERGGVAELVTLRQDFGAETMPAVYAAADLVVQPSLAEGLPFSVVEAMRAGKPVVGTRVIGISDVITDGVDGLLVPAADPPALAEGILRVLTDEALAAELAANAYTTAEREFSSRRMVADTLDGYRVAMARRRQSASAAPTS